MKRNYSFLKKVLFYHLLFFAVFNLGQAQEQIHSYRRKEADWASVEMKIGYFTFASSKMRNIYQEGGIDLQISSTFSFISNPYVKLYASLEYSEKQGYSLFSHSLTRFWQIPFSFGLRYLFFINSNARYYITLGPRFFFAQQKNFSSYVDKIVNTGGVGGFAQTGFKFLFCKERCFIDLFGEYSYEYAKPKKHDKNVNVRHLQIGGFTGGVGVGVFF